MTCPLFNGRWSISFSLFGISGILSFSFLNTTCQTPDSHRQPVPIPFLGTVRSFAKTFNSPFKSLFNLLCSSGRKFFLFASQHENFPRFLGRRLPWYLFWNSTSYQSIHRSFHFWITGSCEWLICTVDVFIPFETRTLYSQIIGQ